MKKYFLIAPVFLVSLLIILFYIVRNIEISKSIDEFTDIKQLSYELELISQKQTIILNKLDTLKNYDEMVAINQNFQNRFTYYFQRIEKIEDKKLARLFKEIQEKNTYLQLLHEDLKTDTAVMKNSLAW